MTTDTASETVKPEAQVQEPPSEEPQVAAPEVSEVEAAVQEPDTAALLAKLTEEEVQALPEDHPVKKLAKAIADKSTLKLRRELETKAESDRQQRDRERQLEEARQAQQQRQNTYRQLQALRQQDSAEWQKYMDDPQYAAIWAEGGRTMPSTEEIDRARLQGFNELYGGLYQRIMNREEMTSLSDKDLERLAASNFAGKSDAHALFLEAAIDVLTERKAAVMVAKEKPTIEEAARKSEREKVQAKYREAGIGPEEIEGEAAKGKGIYTRTQLAKMTPQEYAAKEEDIVAAQWEGRIKDE